MEPVADTDWAMGTDYDGEILCWACDQELLTGSDMWRAGFTVTRLLTLIAAHKLACPKRKEEQHEGNPDDGDRIGSSPDRVGDAAVVAGLPQVTPVHAGANGACPDYGSRLDPCPADCASGTCHYATEREKTTKLPDSM